MAPGRLAPDKYKQPIRDFIQRTLNGSAEEVDFAPKTNIRIWYNTQAEGYSTHHHSAMECIVCVENTYTVVTTSQTYHMNVGDILVIPPHMLHEIVCENDGARFIFLINIDMFTEFEDYQSLSPIFMNTFFCSATTKPAIYQEIYANFMQMVEIYFSNELFWETSIFSILLQSYSLIGKDHFNTVTNAMDSANPNKHREHHEKFIALLSYIDANYQEDLTLEQAADYIGFSKYHFSRLFKQHTNTTFYDYLSHKRIQAAQSLLSMDIPITDIAFQTGFNNLTTFCRCFKKVTNCSPSEYRNKLRHESV